MKLSTALKALLAYIKELRKDSDENLTDYSYKLNWSYSKYRTWVKEGKDIKMSRFLQICRKHKQQPWIVMRHALEHGYDFTEPDHKDWGE